MTTDLPKTYDPTTLEAQVYEVWLKERAFHAEPEAPGAPYSIVIPPPNVTGALHLGHAINNTLQDILIRQHRMMGHNTVWIPGIDHAGIATQAVVEKQLKETENKTRHDIGREGLVERIWQWKQQFGDRIIEQLKRLGCSCDWDRTRFTLDEQCARAVRETFFKLFKDGLIYRGKRLVNWDVHLQTSISDDEIYHENVKTSLWHIRYPIVNGPDERRRDEETERRSDGDSGSSTSSLRLSVSPSLPTHMVVATTRPETMLGDTAVAVHPDDPRWNWAIGKSVKLPLTDRLIPIIADDILVDPKFGTGCVKVTPAHDPNDYAVWQRHQGKADQIDIINILTPDGKINENGGPYAGMKRDAARKKVVEDLTHQGLLEKEEPYETQVGHSDRSKTPVEPYLSDQWFVKMAPLAEPALEVVRNGTIKFFPERHAQQYLSWLGEKRDWPISRQLWWGHRIPVWTFQGQPEQLNEIWRHIDSNDPDIAGLSVKGFARWEQDSLFARSDSNVVKQDIEPPKLSVCIRPGRSDLEKRLEQLGFVQDPDVLDTWFSSALWPHSTLGWPEQTPDLAKWYPTSVLLTGRDIITLWVARMVMTGMYNMGKRRSDEVTERRSDAESDSSTSSLRLSVSPSLSASDLGIPFHHVAINPTILDGKGERMSKTKGNGVDPVDIIETHGADALRFTLTTMATETQDVRMPVQVVCPHCDERFNNPDSKDPQVTCPKCHKLMTRPMGTARATDEAPMARLTSEKFDPGRNFCNKLWNAARFVLAQVEERQRDGETKRRSDTHGSDSSTSSLRLSVSPSLSDHWILSRFNRTVEDANTALSNYRFDQYAKACYDFFWRDFCDWYVEASKPAMKDPARAGQTANVLAAVLDGALRLMHPMIPFITEAIWWRLNEVRPQRGVAGHMECPPSERLIKATWPIAGPASDEVEQNFARLQEIIVAIRNVRNEHKVDVKKTVNVLILSPADAAKQINESGEMIELLATCVIREAGPNVKPPPNPTRIVAAGCEIFVEGLVDADAEKQRLVKRREELTRQIAAMKGRLSNQGYIAKAPPHLVKQTQDQLAEAEAELAKLE